MGIDRRFLISALAVVAVAVALELMTDLSLSFSMKGSDYGIPLFSPLLAISLVYLCILLSREARRSLVLRTIFEEAGRASLFILYLDQFVQTSLLHYLSIASPLLRVALGLIIPYFCYRLFRKLRGIALPSAPVSA